MNRKQRRRKIKNRLFTKKGYTRVVKIDHETGKAINIPTKKGSALDAIAHRNSKKRQKRLAKNEV